MSFAGNTQLCVPDCVSVCDGSLVERDPISRPLFSLWKAFDFCLSTPARRFSSPLPLAKQGTASEMRNPGGTLAPRFHSPLPPKSRPAAVGPCVAAQTKFLQGARQSKSRRRISTPLAAGSAAAAPLLPFAPPQFQGGLLFAFSGRRRRLAALLLLLVSRLLVAHAHDAHLATGGRTTTRDAAGTGGTAPSTASTGGTGGVAVSTASIGGTGGVAVSTASTGGPAVLSLVTSFTCVPSVLPSLGRSFCIVPAGWLGRLARWRASWIFPAVFSQRLPRTCLPSHSKGSRPCFKF
eukprot:GHVT01001984.1.p1 GENE.GHVT01001984.1~~GHVT01001984.1.p1  ORF type:complete len:293 (-),score=48.46 GHVT01001984.1:259-1137(-)